MSNFFFSRNIKRIFRKLISGSLAFLLLVQMFGPGLFAIQQAFAVTGSTLFENGFEGNNVPVSFSQWTSKNGVWNSDTTSPHSGLRKAFAFGDTGEPDVLRKAVSTKDHKNLNISFWYQLRSLENGDLVKVQWTNNGTTWNDLVTFTDGDEKEVWTQWQGSLPLGAEDSQNFAFRFWVNFDDGETKTDKFYLDDVKLTGEDIQKINICHQTGSEQNPLEAIRINASAWDGGPDHEGHGDFIYGGPVNNVNQQPTEDGDNWCAENRPDNSSEEPNIDISKTAKYNGDDVVTYTINWKVTEGNVNNLTITDTLPAWTDLVVNSMSPSTTPPLVPGSRNFDNNNPTANREIVWNLGSKEKGSEGTITFKVELWVKKTCEISPNKVLAVATYGDNTIREDAKSESIKIDSERCNDTPPPAPICEPGVELIKNGDFEMPTVNNQYGWNIFDSGFTGLDWAVNWMDNSGEGRPDIAKLELHDGVNTWAPKSGEQYAELDTDWGGPTSSQSDEPASVQIYQDIPTVPGKSYELKFSFSPRPSTSLAENILGVLWGGETATTSIIAGAGGSNTSWTDYVLKLKATTTLTRVSFADLGVSNSVGTFLDNVSVQCVTDCVETEGEVLSGTDTIVKHINVGETESHPNTPAVLVTPTSITDQYWTADDNGDFGSAKWIWSEDPVTEWDTSDKFVTFRKEFNVNGDPTSGSVVVAADNSYEVWVNGTKVGENLTDQGHVAPPQNIALTNLVNGSNSVEIRVKNLAQAGEALNNPAGLIFKISWKAKNCDNGEPNDPETSKVFVKKYIDGVVANSENTNGDEFKIKYNTSSGNGDVILGANNNYTWESPELTNFAATADVSENTTETEPANDKVIPLGGECRPNMYRLAGYSVGSSFSDAALNATTSSVHLNIQDSNKYVIIWNETCPSKPTLEITKSASYATSTGEITFNINWSVNNGDVSNLVITDPVPTGLTFISADNGGTHDAGNPGVVTWNLGSQTSGANGTVSFVASLNAWNSGLKWASGYESNNQAKRKDGTNVLAERTDPTDMFGAPQSAGNPTDTVVNGSFFSLGFDNGNVVVTFSGTIFNGPGNDVKVYEVTGGTYPDELVNVDAWNGSSWTSLGTVTRDGSVDLGSLSSTTKIRLTEASNKALFESTADGYDVDAVEALNLLPNVCGVDNTVTATASYGEEGTLRASASVNLEINKNLCVVPPDDGGTTETFSFGTTTIYATNLAGNISDVIGDITKWFFYNDETDVIDNGLGSFVFGPATAVLGNGSAQASVTGSQRRNIATYQFKDVKLSDIKTLRFSTFSQSAGNGSPLAERSAYLNFNVDFDNSDTWQKRLVYLPSINGAVVNDTWQSWDAIDGGNALWLYSGATWPITGEPGGTPKTWSQILIDYPNAETRSTDSWFGFRIGEPYTDGFTGNVDRVIVGIKSGTNTHTQTYDFEPVVEESDCTSGCGGDGGGDDTVTTNSSHRSSRGGSSGSVLGASSLMPNNPEVAGAFTELPGLPDTGNAPITRTDTSSVNAVIIIFSGILALLALNFVSFRILKVQK